MENNIKHGRCTYINTQNPDRLAFSHYCRLGSLIRSWNKRQHGKITVNLQHHENRWKTCYNGPSARYRFVIMHQETHTHKKKKTAYCIVLEVPITPHTLHCLHTADVLPTMSTIRTATGERKHSNKLNEVSSNLWNLNYKNSSLPFTGKVEALLHLRQLTKHAKCKISFPLTTVTYLKHIKTK